MRIQEQPELHLTYCLNVHRSETLDDVIAALKGPASAVKRRVSPDAPFGVGLQLPCQVAKALSSPDKSDVFQALLEELGFYVFTLNGFAHGAFHGQRIKEDVYKPDWRENERRDYTCLLAQLLGGWLADGTEGSISTVPGSFKAWIRRQSDIRLMAHTLMEVVDFLAELHASTGKLIHLGLEPEPGCFLESTDSCLAFFKEQVFREGIYYLGALRKRTATDAEALVRRHLGICLDTCHCAIAHELPSAALARYAAEGIRVSKIQLSAAIQSGVTPAHIEALTALAEPTYLHQVKGTAGDKVLSWQDLPEALAEVAKTKCTALRVHFHVPLYWEGSALLQSTRDTLSQALFHHVLNGATSHLEIETYTFEVLPEDMCRQTVEDSIASEFAWVLAHLGKA